MNQLIKRKKHMNKRRNKMIKKLWKKFCDWLMKDLYKND